MLGRNLLKLLRRNTIYVVERFIATDVLETGRRIVRRGLADLAVGFTGRARFLYNRRRPKDRFKQVVALDSLVIRGLRLRFLYLV